MNERKLQIVFGLQWGSEGKGQVCAHLARNHKGPMLAVRVGGTNAGHTATGFDGVERKVQNIPIAAFVNPDCIPLIGCAGMVDPAILLRELRWLDETWLKAVGMPYWKRTGLIWVDESAIVILPKHKDLEKKKDMRKTIGSTAKGVGAATADKVMRTALTFKQWLRDFEPEGAIDANLNPDDIDYLRNHVAFCDTRLSLNRSSAHTLVQLEGSQGYLLSLDTSGYYPFCTSRNCGPEAIAAQAGTNLRVWPSVEIWGVARTFPIRVAGNSGPLPNEIDWSELVESTGGYVKEAELTTVTKLPRRIARLDRGQLARCIGETGPTHLALTFLDYLFPDLNDHPLDYLPVHSLDWVSGLEKDIGHSVDLISAGPGHILRLKPTMPTPERFQQQTSLEIEAALEWTQGLREMPEGIRQQLLPVALAVENRLKEAGQEYGEDVLFYLGEDSALLMLAHKILRGLWSRDKYPENRESRRDTYLDIAGYALLEMARFNWDRGSRKQKIDAL